MVAVIVGVGVVITSVGVNVSDGVTETDTDGVTETDTDWLTDWLIDGVIEIEGAIVCDTD